MKKPRSFPATLSLAPTTAFIASCSGLGGTTSTWSNGSSSTWSNNAAWSAGTPNSATTSACIVDGVSTVTLDINASIDDLQLGTGNTLNFNGNTQLSVFGTQMINDGQMVMNGGGGTNTYLFVDNNMTLSGTGSLTLFQTISGGGGTNIYSNVGADTLTNQSTIQGEGTIGAGTAMSIKNSGTIDANSAGGPLSTTLLLNPGGGASITNTGLLEATNNGVLQLSANIANGGGNITATGAGATVEVNGIIVTGGTFNAVSGGTVETVGSAILDGSTGAGAITMNGQYTGIGNSQTFILGTINNNNNIQLNGGGGTNTYLLLNGSTTLQGGGTVTMNTPTSGGGNSYIYSNVGPVTLTNVNNTIQGEGLLGNGAAVNLVNKATIDANSTDGALNTILLLDTPAGVTNTGLMEATNVGVLEITATVVNNAGGNITANGAGALVQLDGGTTIQGGNLNAVSGGTVQTVSSAILDGNTASGAITLNGQYTGTANSQTFILGTINNSKNIQLNGGAGTNTYLLMNASVTLKGGGTVTLLDPTSGGGSAYLYSNVGPATLTNVNNTIQGEGLLGDGTAMTLLNQASGIINANSTGSPLNTILLLDTPAGVTNTGLMEWKPPTQACWK